MRVDDDTMYKSIEMASTLLAAKAVSAATSKAWTRRKATDPPTNPRQADVPWIQAILWSAAIGAVIGVARLLARTAVEKSWEKRTAQA